MLHFQLTETKLSKLSCMRKYRQGLNIVKFLLVQWLTSSFSNRNLENSDAREGTSVLGFWIAILFQCFLVPDITGNAKTITQETDRQEENSQICSSPLWQIFKTWSMFPYFWLTCHYSNNPRKSYHSRILISSLLLLLFIFDRINGENQEVLIQPWDVDSRVIDH
jgi:hypothetical protein